MPAQIFISKGQIATIYELGEGVVVVEEHPNAEALDVWVMDEPTVNSDNHRSIVLDLEGNILTDSVVGDDED